MFKSHAKRIRTAIALAVAAALTVGGVAAAQGANGGAGHSRGARGPHHRHPQGPPPMGLPMKGLTYAEIHVEQKGEAKVIAVEQGKVTSVGESSITLSENDGSEATVATSTETKVLGRPGSEPSLSQLQGKLVIVSGPSGGAARHIVIEPKRPAKGEGGERRGAGPQGEGRGAGPRGEGRGAGPRGEGRGAGPRGANRGLPPAGRGHGRRRGGRG